MAGQACEHERAAVEAQTRYGAQGLLLDFSLASLSCVEVFVRRQAGCWGRAPGGEGWSPTAEDVQHAQLLGSYAGEVLRRRLGGRWQRREGDMFPVLVLPGEGEVDPFVLLLEQFRSGMPACARRLRAAFERAGGRETIADGAAWVRVAAMFLGMDEPVQARDHLTRAVELAPAMSGVWRRKGEIEEGLGWSLDALASYRAALAGPDVPGDMAAALRDKVLELSLLVESPAGGVGDDDLAWLSEHRSERSLSSPPGRETAPARAKAG